MSASRRQFLGAALAAGVAPELSADTPQNVSPNSRVRVALIGNGIQGSGDARQSIAAGAGLVAVADVYEGRLTKAKEVWGDRIFTTRDYREVLARPDVDAVIIAVPDHWHKQMSIDAMSAGKDVYCEKPMVQLIEDGHDVVDAQKRTGRILQVGSQRVSSVVYHKAKELIEAGAIGEINLVEAWVDRNTAIGAWQYSIPPDASPSTIDWDRFLGRARSAPSSRSASSAGATTATTELGSAETCSCICSPVCISSSGRTALSVSTPPAASGIGKTAAMCPT